MINQGSSILYLAHSSSFKQFLFAVDHFFNIYVPSSISLSLNLHSNPSTNQNGTRRLNMRGGETMMNTLGMPYMTNFLLNVTSVTFYKKFWRRTLQLAERSAIVDEAWGERFTYNIQLPISWKSFTFVASPSCILKQVHHIENTLLAAFQQRSLQKSLPLLIRPRLWLATMI